MPIDSSPLVEPEHITSPPQRGGDMILASIEKLLLAEYAPRKLYHGRIEARSNGQKEVFSSALFFKSITFYADAANSDEIHIGNDTVDTTNCAPLNPNADVTFERIYGGDIWINFVTSADVLWWEGEA